jgi:predicted ATP-dependent Lon-type protease
MENQINTKLLPRTTKMKENRDEWLDILKNIGITPEELDRLSRNNLFAHLVEAIEMLSRLLLDKNMHIRLLEKENETA